MLNTHKFNNYAFFCPVSRLHLTVSSPVGYANEVTAAILRALKAQTILDVDGVVDIETGTVKTAGKANVDPVKEEKAPEQPKSSESENNGSTSEGDKAEEVTVNETDNQPSEGQKTEGEESTADTNAENVSAKDESTADTNAEDEATEEAAKSEDKPKRGGRKAKADAE